MTINQKFDQSSVNGEPGVYAAAMKMNDLCNPSPEWS